MKVKTQVKAMYVLDGGSFINERAMMLYGKDMDKWQRIPVPFFAFETEQGWVLFDTGCPPGAGTILEGMGRKPLITDDNFAVNQLAMIGVRPEDIAIIIQSHLHLDHAGGLHAFPNAKIYVQKDELAFAKYPNVFQAEIFDPTVMNLETINWQLLEGDQEILPGLTVMLTNGHTPGMQSLVVELPESGFSILAADAIYLTENTAPVHPQGLAWNLVLAQYSITRLNALQSLLDARLYPGHDEQFYKDNVVMRKAMV